MTRDHHRPLRIAHIADTHLGYSAYGKADPISGRNQRAVDIENAFARAVSDILTREVDLVLHAGDVFHHTRPSWSTLTHFVQQMRRLEHAGLPAVVIAGNHDTPRLRTTGSVYGLMGLALPSVRFMTGYEYERERFDELGLMVHGVPHGSLTNPEPPMLLHEREVRNVVVAHGIVPGHLLHAGHEPGETDIRGNVLSVEFDYVALGHIHIHGPSGTNAYYSGSTERTSWGDHAASPGYVIVTLDEPGSLPRIEHIELPARPMETLSPIDGGDRAARELADTVLERAEARGLPEAMFRVELKNVDRPLFREVDAIVRRETGTAAWHIRLTVPGEADDPLRREMAAGLADLHPISLFERFVNEQEASGRYDKKFSAAFRQRGRAALEKAIARVQEASTSEGAT